MSGHPEGSLDKCVWRRGLLLCSLHLAAMLPHRDRGSGEKGSWLAGEEEQVVNVKCAHLYGLQQQYTVVFYL